MKLRHFVYGKFKLEHSRLERLVSGGGHPAGQGNLYNGIVNKIGSLGSVLSDDTSPAELILRLPEYDAYVFVRFYPFIRDFQYRPVSGFHAFVLSEAELASLEYAPWMLEKYFIRAFEADQIIGYDGRVWVRAGEEGEKTVEITHPVPLPAGKADGGKSPFAWPRNEPGKFIQSRTPFRLLNALQPEQRWFVCSVGVLFIHAADRLPDYADFKIVFVTDPAAKPVPGRFRQLTESNFGDINPVKTREEPAVDPEPGEPKALPPATGYVRREDRPAGRRPGPPETGDPGAPEPEAARVALLGLQRRLVREKHYKLALLAGLVLLAVLIPLVYELVIIPQRLHAREVRRRPRPAPPAPDTVFRNTSEAGLPPRADTTPSRPVQPATSPAPRSAADCNRQIRLADEKIGLLSAEIQGKKDLISTLQNRYNTALVEIDGLKASLEARRRDIQQLTGQQAAALAEAGRLRTELRQKETEHSNLREQHRTLQAEVERLRAAAKTEPSEAVPAKPTKGTRPPEETKNE